MLTEVAQKADVGHRGLVDSLDRAAEAAEKDGVDVEVAAVVVVDEVEGAHGGFLALRGGVRGDGFTCGLVNVRGFGDGRWRDERGEREREKIKEVYSD